MQEYSLPPQSGNSMEPDNREDYERFRIKLGWKNGLRSQGGLLALTVIVNVLLLYVIQTAASWVLSPLLWEFPQLTDLANELFTFFLYILAFLLPYLAYAKLVHFSFREIPCDRPDPPVLASCVGIALGVSVAGVLLSALVSLFFSLFGLYPMEFPTGLPSQPLVALLYLLNMTVLPAVVEELVHRGIVLGSLRRYGDGFAIVISSILFAMLHRNMVQAPNALLLGLLLGYFMVKTNSIFTSMTIHFVNNLIAVLLSIFVENMGDMGAFLVQSALWLVYLAACAAGLIYLLGVRRVQLELMRPGCPLDTAELHGYFWSTLPAVVMVLLMIWVTFLNFTR